MDRRHGPAAGRRAGALARCAAAHGEEPRRADVRRGSGHARARERPRAPVPDHDRAARGDGGTPGHRDVRCGARGRARLAVGSHRARHALGAPAVSRRVGRARDVATVGGRLGRRGRGAEAESVAHPGHSDCRRARARRCRRHRRLPGDGNRPPRAGRVAGRVPSERPSFRGAGGAAPSARGDGEPVGQRAFAVHLRHATATTRPAHTSRRAPCAPWSPSPPATPPPPATTPTPYEHM